MKNKFDNAPGQEPRELSLDELTMVTGGDGSSSSGSSDDGSGLPTGQRIHKPLDSSSTGGSSDSSGLPTGKRQHSPFTL